MALYTSTPPEGAEQKIWGHLAPYPHIVRYPTHKAINMKGGYRSVETATARNAIPASHRKHGMKVYVKTTNNIYRLKSDLTSWIVVSSSTPNPTISSPYTRTTHHNRGCWDRIVCHRYTDGRLEYFMRSSEQTMPSNSQGWYYKQPTTASLPYTFSKFPSSIFCGKSKTGIVFAQILDIENSRAHIKPQMFTPTSGSRGYMYAHLFGRWK